MEARGSPKASGSPATSPKSRANRASSPGSAKLSADKAPPEEQGDPEVDALQKRSAVRNHPAMLHVLGRWWYKTLANFSRKAPGALVKREYCNLYSRLLRAQHTCDERAAKLSAHELQDELELDWERDSQGSRVVTRARFFDAIYGIPDQWVDTVSVTDYVTYLAKMERFVFVGSLKGLGGGSAEGGGPEPTPEEDARTHGVAGTVVRAMLCVAVRHA